jgi:hypothetical protein
MPRRVDSQRNPNVKNRLKEDNLREDINYVKGDN